MCVCEERKSNLVGILFSQVLAKQKTLVRVGLSVYLYTHKKQQHICQLRNRTRETFIPLLIGPRVGKGGAKMVAAETHSQMLLSAGQFCTFYLFICKTLFHKRHNRYDGNAKFFGNCLPKAMYARAPSDCAHYCYR